MGLLLGQGSHWGSQGLGFPLGWLQVKGPIGVAPGQGLGGPWPLGPPKASWPFGTPKATPLGLWAWGPIGGSLGLIHFNGSIIFSGETVNKNSFPGLNI